MLRPTYSRSSRQVYWLPWGYAIALWAIGLLSITDMARRGTITVEEKRRSARTGNHELNQDWFKLRIAIRRRTWGCKALGTTSVDLATTPWSARTTGYPIATCSIKKSCRTCKCVIRLHKKSKIYWLPSISREFNNCKRRHSKKKLPERNSTKIKKSSGCTSWTSPSKNMIKISIEKGKLISNIRPKAGSDLIYFWTNGLAEWKLLLLKLWI